MKSIYILVIGERLQGWRTLVTHAHDSSHTNVQTRTNAHSLAHLHMHTHVWGSEKGQQMVPHFNDFQGGAEGLQQKVENLLVEAKDTRTHARRQTYPHTQTHAKPTWGPEKGPRMVPLFHHRQ